MAGEFEIGRAVVTVRIKDDTRADEARIKSRLNGIEGRARVKVDVDANSFNRAVRSITNGSNQISTAMSRIGRSSAQLAILGGVATTAGAAIAALPALAGGAASAIGVLAGSFAGVGDALKGYQADQKASAGASVQGSNAAASNARAIRDASTAISDARRNAARVARDTAAAIADAERDAVKVARDTAEAITEARQNEADVARESAERITDAREHEADVAEDVAERVSDARENQVRVAERGAETIANASENVSDALEKERDAQKSLTDARKDAARDLEDLREKVSDYALDQEGAAIRVAEAEHKLELVMRAGLAPASLVRDAQYDLAVAREKASDLAREQAEATAELTAAEAAGVDGSDKVRTAQEKLADAHKAVEKAQQDLVKAQTDAAKANQDAADATAKAVKDGAKAQQEAAKRTADAVQDGARAQQEAADRTAKVVRDGAEAQADAARRVAEAQRDGAEAQQDAARAVADAVQNLADVQAEQGESASIAAGKTSKYADAMAKLTPAGRDFVEQLIRMKPLVKGLSDASATAFLPGLTQMLRDSEGLFPIFETHLTRVGTIMGDSARKMGELFKTEEFKRNLTTFLGGTEPIIKSIGDGFVSITDKLVEFGAKMAPLSKDIAKFIDRVVEGFEGFLDALVPYQDTFGSIFDSLGRIAKAVLPALGDAVGSLAEVIEPPLKRLADWLEKNPDKIDDMIESIVGMYVVLKGIGVVSSVAKLVTGIIKEWNRLPGGAKSAAGKAALALGTIMVARGAAEGYSPKQEKELDEGGIGSDLSTFSKDFTGDPLGALGKEIRASLTPPEETKELWNQFSDWFGGKMTSLKDIATGVWDGISTKVTGVKDWLTGTVFPGLQNGTQWVGDKFSAVGSGIGAAWDWVGTKLEAVGNWISGTVFAGLKNAAGWVGDKFNAVRDSVSAAWDWVGIKLEAVGNWISNAIFVNLRNAAQWVGDKFNVVRDSISNAWDWVGRKLEAVGNWISNNIFANLRNAAQWVADKFNNVRDSISNAFQWVGDRLSAIGSWISNTVFGGLNRAVDGVGRTFQNVADWIGRAWNSIQEAARRPVQWVIDVVYNNGVRKMWNGIAGTFGMSKLDPVQMATGGIMPGYTPGKDVHKFFSPTGGGLELSGGEAVMRPEWTQAAGSDYVARANAAARSGGVQGAAAFIEKNGLPGFANGGIMSFAEGGIMDTIGGWFSSATDFLSDVFTNPANTIRRIFEGVLGDSGRTPGGGSWRDMLVKLPGKAVDGIIGKVKKWMEGEGGGAGAAGVGGALSWARSQAGKPYVWASAGPGGYDCSGFMSAITNVIRGKNPYQRIGATSSFPWPGFQVGRSSPFVIGSTKNAGGGIGHMAGTLGGVNVESNGSQGVVIGGRTGANSGMFNTRAGLAFDGGGIAQGVGFMPKATIEPERVLSPAQTAAFDQLVASITNGGGSGGVHINNLTLQVDGTLDPTAPGFEDTIYVINDKLIQIGRRGR